MCVVRVLCVSRCTCWIAIAFVSLGGVRCVFVLSHSLTLPLRRYVKGRISKMLQHLAKKVVFVPSAAGLAAYVNEPEQSLPSSTLSVDSEVKAIFDKVQQVSNRGVKDVILRVATTSLQVISAKHYQLLGAPSPLTDLYHISRIEEVTNAVDGSVVVKCAPTSLCSVVLLFCYVVFCCA